MKTFYDLQDIDKTIEIVINLSAITDNGIPHAKIVCNNKLLLDADINDSLIIKEKLDIMSLVNISVTLSNKTYNIEKETALIVDSITIDNIEIIPKYSHCTEYINDQNQSITTNYLGFNGTWSLDLDRPFYQWLHQETAQGWLLQPYEKNPQKYTKRY